MEKKMELKQTGVKVRLIVEDGNAFRVWGKARAALRRAGYGQEFIKAFTDEATGGDYNHLLATVTQVVGGE